MTEYQTGSATYTRTSNVKDWKPDLFREADLAVQLRAHEAGLLTWMAPPDSADATGSV